MQNNDSRAVRQATLALVRVREVLFPGSRPAITSENAANDGLKLLLIHVDHFVAERVLGSVSVQQTSIVADDIDAFLLEKLQRNAFDLLLMGHDPGAFDAPGVCGHVRREMIMTPILVLSGFDHSAIILSLDSGADRCLPGVLTSDEIMAHIRALVRRYRIGQRLR